MPRPDVKMVTLTIDGREVEAPEGTMLVDGAKYGDVEIPVFCYEPKLGPPVGACRMCLVEIEGIPKLQTACSSPVKDGMVVNTATERVRAAQQAVVEFLLINHPLDCPVCDKGGECPLQDISYGWGSGTSRFIEPKRHFRKPLELSPLVAIDRERCILCYRCVRFSQDVSEDYQLVLHERGAHTYVGTFDGHPYVGPFTGNIVDLCPVGALTSTAYRFRARPWDIENSGSLCTLCPAQCNVSFTVRDEKVLRVFPRGNAHVDDSWLCDKGRFAYQSIHVDERITQPMVRDGGSLRPVSWERALDEAATALRKAGPRSGAIVGGQTPNEEGFLLQRLFREALRSGHLDSRGGGTVLPLALTQALAHPTLQATLDDVEYADTVVVLDTEPVDDAPVFDLRIRKGINRRGTQLVVAGARQGALDPKARRFLRYAPGAGEAFLHALDVSLQVAAGEADPESVAPLAHAASADAIELRLLADLLLTGGDDVVILWGERLLAGPRGPQAARALLNVVARLGLAGRDGAGLLEVPGGTNGRGLRDVGVLPNVGPGLSEPETVGLGAQDMAQATAAGEIAALYLLHADPLRTQPDRPLWEAALGKATAVIAHASTLTEGIAEYATVVFPAESYAEKEGTVVHPDGRLQRLRQAIGRPGEVRPGWQVINELAQRADHDLGVLVGSMASTQVFRSVPYWSGITLDEIGGTGLRWDERAAANRAPRVDLGPFALEPLAPAPDDEGDTDDDGSLRLGTFHSLWVSPEVEISPSLAFLHPAQQVELAPADAQRLGLAHGDEVEVARNGSSVHAPVALRAANPVGTAFLVEGTPTASANALTNGHQQTRVTVRRVAGAESNGHRPGDVSGAELTGAGATGDTPTQTAPTGKEEG